MDAGTSLLDRARALAAAGRWNEARALLEPLAAHDDDAAFLTAQAEVGLGRYDDARTRLLGLRERLPGAAPMLDLHLASLEQLRGHTEEAIARLRSAIAADARMGAAYKNLAALLATAGRADEALAALQAGAQAVPADAGLWLRLARVQSNRGDGTAALASLERARDARPAEAETWRQIGQLFGEYWRWAEADAALAEASRLDPGAPPIETLWAVVKQELGDVGGAQHALERASARDPGDLHAALGLRLLLPQVYADETDVARWRRRYTEGLQEVSRSIEQWLPRAPEVFTLNRNNFLLAYQGGDDRELQRGYSALLARLAGAVHPEWRAPRPRSFDGARRLRVGFVSSIFRDCTAGRYFERWITALDPKRIERFVYHTSAVADDFTRRIASGAEHFTVLREGPLHAAGRLAADALDVIVHPEVGMTPGSYLLAALRLAPVQCAGWGHPVTTGSDAIDYYLTCAPMEPQDAKKHYVEELLPLPGIGVDYAMPSTPVPATRADFRLPAEGRLYLCAQSLFKIHPAMDAMFAAILEGDERAVLAFFQAPAPHVTRQFAARLERTMAARGMAPRGQLKFLPRLPGAHFRRALALADVVLDTLHWSGGNTSLDAFSVATPVVTLPGRFMRGRQTAAMLGMMGIEGLTASDADDYVRRALAVARDRDLNAGLREAIAARRAALFDRPEPIAALQEALLAAAAKT